MNISGVSNSRLQKQQQNERRPEDGSQSASKASRQFPQLPSPKNKNVQEGSGYLANFSADELGEDRLHKSKSRTVKLNQSSKDALLVTSIQVHQNLITVKQEKLGNSTVPASQVPAFKSEQFQGKKVKKFSISALIKQKQLIKQSNYFDESHLGEQQLNPIVNKANADFRMGQIGNFQTFQVKTYLYDRNLSQKINR